MVRVAVNPDLLRWARERARMDYEELVVRFPKLPEWEADARQPTLKQLEEFARATRTPVGFLFLQSPPAEAVPIPDFRTIANQEIARPGPDLLDTIYLCQQRQAWYREHAQLTGYGELDLVGSASTRSAIAATTAEVRRRLGFDLQMQANSSTWEEALRKFIAKVDEAGVMVMCSGVVGNNNYRRLDPQEFRGFALSDPLAPLIFINGADTKSAQMFTLAHELAHLLIGETALSNVDPGSGEVPEELAQPRGRAIEQWCNAFAAEFLVPMSALQEELRSHESIEAAKTRLARRFKVSTLVVLRRMFDAQRISSQRYWQLYRAELQYLQSLEREGGGGNFYLSQAARVSKRFARALVESTLEGTTLYRDAMRMVGVSKVGTFHELGRSLGMPI